MKRLLMLVFYLLSFAAMAAATDEETMCRLPQAMPQEQPVTYKMKLISILEGNKTEYVFAVGASGFKTVESLEAGLRHYPHGSILEWSQGCKQTGAEPLLSNEKDMENFKKFCSDIGIDLRLTSSG